MWPTHGAASPGEEERSARAGCRDEFQSLSLNKPEQGREFWGVGRTVENHERCKDGAAQENPSQDIAVPSRIPEGRLFPNGDPDYCIVQSQRTGQEQRSSSWFSEKLRKRSGAGLHLKKFLPLQTPRLCQ